MLAWKFHYFQKFFSGVFYLDMTLSSREALPRENVGLLAATSFDRKMKDPMKKLTHIHNYKTS